MKIYVIQKGCYSDKSVVTATIDKEIAEKIKQELLFERPNETVEILEMEDAFRPSHDTRNTYLVKFDNHFHYVSMIEEILQSYKNYELDLKENQVEEDFDEEEFVSCYTVRVKAHSDEEAKKIACDCINVYQYQKKMQEEPDDLKNDVPFQVTNCVPIYGFSRIYAFHTTEGDAEVYAEFEKKGNNMEIRTSIRYSQQPLSKTMESLICNHANELMKQYVKTIVQ